MIPKIEIPFVGIKPINLYIVKDRTVLHTIIAINIPLGFTVIEMTCVKASKNFENDSLASSSLSNSFWTYFDETDTLANYVTLTPLDSVNSLGGGSGAMLMEYNITKYANWGGFGAIYHIYDSPIDMSNYNQLSFRVNNTLAAALSQAIEIRVALYDGSDATTEYLNPATATTEPRDFVENWYTFFKNPRFVDGESGWNEIRIPLAQSNESNPNYRDGFGSGPGDVGIAGNNVMDLDHIVGIAIEAVSYTHLTLPTKRIV